MSTPALARATEALVGSYGGPVDSFRGAARAAVSAALHDPDDSDWLMDLILDVDRERGWHNIFSVEASQIADAIRQRILGEAS